MPMKKRALNVAAKTAVCFSLIMIFMLGYTFAKTGVVVTELLCVTAAAVIAAIVLIVILSSRKNK